MGKSIEDMTDDELTQRLADVDSGLSSWEVEFVDSIRKQVKTGRSLSKKQREIAERIARDKT